MTNKKLVVSGIDITHARLVELTKLADKARPFYDWIESRFQEVLSRKDSLDEILRTASKSEIHQAILSCYSAANEKNIPFLFDGIGRSYPHAKACYYMFSWLIRDAPQQRLSPLIQRITKISRKSKSDAEVEALAELFFKYRVNVKTFEWKAVREVLIDRLEGSRRSIKGHEKETIVRTAVLVSIQTFFENNGNYGVYSRVELIDKQVSIGNETYDVSVNLIDGDGKSVQRILIPIKTRETEGGGHAHLFTRDIKSAMSTAKNANPDDYLIAVIVAKNWSEREKENIRKMVDHAAIFDISPNEFSEFSDEEQVKLDMFVDSLLSGKINPKPLLEQEG
jgi:hypothetical protein